MKSESERAIPTGLHGQIECYGGIKMGTPHSLQDEDEGQRVLKCPSCGHASAAGFMEPIDNPVSLDEYKIAIHKNTREKGFHENCDNFHRELNLIIGELMEAMEADRHANWHKNRDPVEVPTNIKEWTFPEFNKWYMKHFDNAVEMEIIDTFIRLFDFCGLYEINIESLLKLKMRYNQLRPGLRGRRY